MTLLLEAQQVSLLPRLPALDLSCIEGEMIALVGANGSGKTSLLRALARLPGAAGTVLIDGEYLDQAGEARRRLLLSLLPASHEVAWPISVADVVALGSPNVAGHRLEQVIEDFAIGHVRNREIGSLSTGERSRALLARAMVAAPRLLLLDEPLSNLDPYWTLRTLQLLRAAARRGAAVILALHDLAQVSAFDRLILLSSGVVVGDGRPDAMRPQLGVLFGVEPTIDGWKLSEG